MRLRRSIDQRGRKRSGIVSFVVRNDLAISEKSVQSPELQFCAEMLVGLIIESIGNFRTADGTRAMACEGLGLRRERPAAEEGDVPQSMAV